MLTGGLAVPPAQAETKAQATSRPDRDWKPESNRNWWDRLWGRHDSRSVPDERDLKVAGVPRRDPAPKSVKAAPVKRVEELTGRRTAHARYWRLADGRIQAELSPEPINFRDGKGKWRPIETTVRRGGPSGFTHGNVTNGFRSFFGSSADRLLRFEDPHGGSLTMGVDGGSSGAPTVKDDTVTYDDTVAGGDLSFTVTPQGVKEKITLTAPPTGDASYSFSFKVKDLRAWQRPDG